MTVLTASLFIAFYVVYISTVFIGRRVYQAQKRKAILLAAASDDDETSAIAAAVSPNFAYELLRRRDACAAARRFLITHERPAQ